MYLISHGTTVTLFEKQSPDQQTNKPVCFDCHGVHNIARVDDPKRGLEVKANMLATCKKCHPDATVNFPDAWLGHYIPDANKHPIVYFVNLFYNIYDPRRNWRYVGLCDQRLYTAHDRTPERNDPLMSATTRYFERFSNL